MSEIVVQRSHGSREVILGAVLAVVGLVILGNAAIATKVSVVFLGWMLVLAGLIGLVAALANLRTGGFWSSAIAGGFFLAVGLMFLRNTEAAAATLTLIAGALFLTTGLVRLMAAIGDGEYRWPLLFSGAGATILGVIVLFNVFDASYTLLGVILGIQTLVEGIAIMLFGRMTATKAQTDGPLPAT